MAPRSASTRARAATKTRAKPKPKTARKASAKKASVKKASAKKASAKKASAKKVSAKKASARKASAKKASAKKASAKRAPAKKPSAKKAPAKKPSAKKASAKKAPAQKPSANKGRTSTSTRGGGRGGLAPLRLVEHGNARFSLCLDEFRMPELAAFRDRGLAGNGHTWQALAHSLVAWQRPDLANELAYDSETALFVAEGPRPALEAVARLLQNALSDPALLNAALDRASPDRLD